MITIYYECQLFTMRAMLVAHSKQQSANVNSCDRDDIQ